MAIIGMDIHRSFAQAGFLQDRQVKKRSNRSISFTTALVRFGKSLSVEDEVAPSRPPAKRRRRADLATFRQARGRGESANGSGDRLCPG